MPRERGLTSPPGVTMEGRSFSLGGGSQGSGAPPPLPPRPAQSPGLSPVSELPSPHGPHGAEKLSTGYFGPAARAVTPEPPPEAAVGGGLDGADNNHNHKNNNTNNNNTSNSTNNSNNNNSNMSQSHAFGSVSPRTSPRSIPAAPATLPARRQCVLFNEAFPSSLDGTSPSPPSRPPSFRPRTHTMDGAFRQQLAPAVETRSRMGSFSSVAHPAADSLRLPPLQPSSFEPYRPAELHPAAAAAAAVPKDRKMSGSRTRLTKRPTSRPGSPLSSLPPSVDSLPLPIPTTDANKVLLLMKNLCGRMRGEVEYRRDVGGRWRSGLCYIEEEKGSLLVDSGDSGSFHTTLIPDLRGCRVVPVDRSDGSFQCLEIASPQPGVPIFLRPSLAEDLDLWLAALLCWQQLRPPGGKPQAPRPAIERRASSHGRREPAIIKVGKVELWDRGAAATPRAIVRRPSTRDLRSPHTCWRTVSCILHDNGELKIMTENDVAVLCVIELGQLARSAVQQLDRSVLDEDYCLAIFPTYASTSTKLSIFRPIYMALESQVLFEVWFVLLRAFTIPDIYTLDPADGGRVSEVVNMEEEGEPAGEMFRVEKTISVRITEAKIRSRTGMGEAVVPERHGRGPDPDTTRGNYLAEIILDGEVRARTTTKTDTRNPFWREDCEFTDLPPSLPCLSVLLKRVDGTPESFAHQLQATLGLAKPGSLTEVLCGSVDISLDQLDYGRDHEQWFPIYDDKQQSIGSMLVRVRHEEVAVLLEQNYKPLSDLLHRFSSGLIAQIADALPGSLRRLAEILVNIFQVSGRANEWLMNMVEDEIDGIGNQATLSRPRFSARLKSNDSIESTIDRDQIVRELGRSLQGEANLLFRGNSLLTQALEFHMRRLGREYLAETLADKIFEINESDANCEVDPSKLHHGEDIQEHWDQLIDFTSEIWDCIASSAARLPPELRHILKYIRAVAEDRYGDFLRTVTYTSVSGFLFLRFLCPAILNPKLFGLLRDHPRPRAQRTLTLIAKSLQALANLTTIGKKETWMEPMNRFLTSQRQAFKDFLDDVCAIPAERTKTALSASYSTPITILGRLPPIAREGFPSLPYLIDQGRNFAALVKLWADAHPASASTSQVYKGDLLEFHNHCIELHQRAMNCLARIDALRCGDAPSQQGEDHDLSDIMDRITLGDMFSLSPYASNSGFFCTEAEGRPPGSSGSDMDGGSSATPALGSSEGSGRSTGTRDARRGSVGREQNPQRQGSRSGDAPANPLSAAAVRTLRNGIHPRKLFSGFIRKTTRTASPDAAPPAAAAVSPSLPGSVNECDRERVFERERGREVNEEREDDNNKCEG